MLDDIKPADEGFDGEGRSYVYHRLKSQGHKLKLPLADLERYDDNVPITCNRSIGTARSRLF